MLLRVLAVFLLCSFLAGGSLLAWRRGPERLPNAKPVLCAPSAAAPAPARPSAVQQELPWVNRDVMPGLLPLADQHVLGRPIRELRVSNDGSRVAALTSDGTLWSLRRDGRSLVRHHLAPHRDGPSRGQPRLKTRFTVTTAPS